MAPSHGVLLASEGGRRLLYALTNFSAANFLQSAVGGGEPGVDTGFGVVALAVWKEVPTGSQMLVQRVNGAVSAGWYLQTSGASLRAVFVSGAGVPVVSASYTIVASDLGRVIEIDASISGGMIWLIVNRQLVGAGVAITGYTPAASEDTVWSLWETTQAFTSGMLLSSATYRGNPSVAQRNAYADETRILGDLPTTIQGATITHRHSLRDQLRAIGGAVTSGQTAPATLEDTITRAAADALARQGSPTVVTIDTSRDGRRMLGVLGNSAANYLVTSQAGAPIGGATTLTFRCKIRHDVVAGSQNIWIHTTDGGSRGFTFYHTGGAISVWSNASNAIVCSYAIGTADLGRTYRYTIVCTGSTWYLYRDGALLAQGAGTYAQSLSPLYVGTNALFTQPNTMVSIFDLAVGAGVATAAEILSADAADRVVIAGRTDQHYWWFGDDILAAGETLPTQFLDRIGTDHLTRVGGVWKQDANSLWFDGGAWYQMAASGVLASPHPWVAVKLRVRSLSVPSGNRYVLAKANGANAGVELRFISPNAMQFLAADNSGARVGATFTLDSSDVGVVRVAVGRVDAAGVRRIALRDRATEVVGAAPYTGYTASPLALSIGSMVGTSPLSGVDIIGCAVGTGDLTTAEIDALLADSDPSTAPVVQGKTERRLYLGPGASSSAPALVADLMGSGEKATLAGAGLQAAQRTERTWSYETSPIYRSVRATSTAQGAYRALSGPGAPGDAAGFWALVAFLALPTGVDASRFLFGHLNNVDSTGWDIRTTGKNALIGVGFRDSGAYALLGSSVIPTSEIGKIHVAAFTWDAPAGMLRPFYRRVAGSPQVRSGHVPATGLQLSLGAASYEGYSATDCGVLGGAYGAGVLTLAEYQAACDHIMSRETLIGLLPARDKSVLIDVSADCNENGGALPDVLKNRAPGATGNALSRSGTLSMHAQTARAYAW